MARRSIAEDSAKGSAGSILTFIKGNVMQRFNNIICVISQDSKELTALERAIALAKSSQAELTIVEVIDEIPATLKLVDRTLWPRDFLQQRIKKHLNRLDEMVASLDSGINIKTRVLSGIAFIEIIREVLRNGHDLLLKTAESSGLLERLLGSDDMHLLRKCPCPVWLFKPQTDPSFRCIVAALDVDAYYPAKELTVRSQLNLQILEMASSLALSESAELHIVYACEALDEELMNKGLMAGPGSEKEAYIEKVTQRSRLSLESLVKKVKLRLEPAANITLKPTIHILNGFPRQQIPEFASQIKADLIVMGTVARTGLAGFFMGNTAETILNQLDCSVLATKPDGFNTPVTVDD